MTESSNLQVLEIIKKPKLNYLRLTQANSIPTINFKNIILFNNPSKDNLNKTICKVIFNEHNQDLNDDITKMYSELRTIISSYYKNIYSVDFDEDVVQHDLTCFKTKKVSARNKINYIFIRLQEPFLEDYDSLDLNYTYNMNLKLKGIYIKPDKILLDWKLSNPISKDCLIKDMYNYIEDEDNNEDASSVSSATQSDSEEPSKNKNEDDEKDDSDNDEDKEDKEDKEDVIEESNVNKDAASTIEGFASDKTQQHSDNEDEEEVLAEKKVNGKNKEANSGEIKDTNANANVNKNDIKTVIEDNMNNKSDNESISLSDSEDENDVIIIDKPANNSINKIRKLKEKEIAYLEEKILMEKSELDIKTQKLIKYLAKLKVLNRKIKTTNNVDEMKKITSVIEKIRSK